MVTIKVVDSFNQLSAIDFSQPLFYIGCRKHVCSCVNDKFRQPICIQIHLKKFRLGCLATTEVRSISLSLLQTAVFTPSHTDSFLSQITLQTTKLLQTNWELGVTLERDIFCSVSPALCAKKENHSQSRHVYNQI